MYFDCVLYSLTGLFTINGVQNKEALSTPGGYSQEYNREAFYWEQQSTTDFDIWDDSDIWGDNDIWDDDDIWGDDDTVTDTFYATDTMETVESTPAVPTAQGQGTLKGKLTKSMNTF